MAQANLSRTLQKYYPDLEIVGMTSSVSGTVEWLKEHSADVIFMDVELSDGDCFSIFRQINVDAKIVMTTAYDSYAVKAFEVNSVDYLLKPIEKRTWTGPCSAAAIQQASLTCLPFSPPSPAHRMSTGRSSWYD